jgi:hypothetical protein
MGQKGRLDFFISIAILNKNGEISDNWVYGVCIDLVGSDCNQ